MSFKAGKIVYNEIPKNMKVDPYLGLPSFSEEDFSYLFYKLQNMDFKGSEMEQIFSLTLKLQELYNFLKSKDQIKP
jgi:hypothetical protein